MKFLVKKVFFFALPLFFAACISDDESEDIEPWNAEAVCPAEGTNAYGMPNRGTFTDERDGQVYRYTTIGDQVWMAENLRYDAPYSTCSNDTGFIRQYCELIEHNCKSETCCRESLCRNFGRYYSIIENGNRFGLIDTILADTTCPKGWHIPTKGEWEKLEEMMTSSEESKVSTVSRMKSSDSTYFSMSSTQINKFNRTNVGTDDCALSIIPSGFMYEDGMTIEFNAAFLSSTQKNKNFMYAVETGNSINYISNVYRNSIRCVMDPVNPEL